MTTMQRATFDDLMATPEDGHLYELVRGEILRMPPPQGPHGRVEVRFTHLIESYLDARALAGGWDGTDADVRDRLVGFTIGGEAGVRFSLPDDPDQTRGMDAAYLDPEQAGRYLDAGASGYIREVPALVAEVISPSDRAIWPVGRGWSCYWTRCGARSASIGRTAADPRSPRTGCSPARTSCRASRWRWHS